MRIRIKSDGTGRGTRVENAETGELVEHVRSVAWVVPSPNEPAEAILKVTAVEVDVDDTAAEVHEQPTGPAPGERS